MRNRKLQRREIYMAKTAWIFSYKIKKNVTDEEFIEKTKSLHDEVISKAKGFISWEHYVQENTWTDFVLWESEEDANNATTVGQGHKAVSYTHLDVYKRQFYDNTTCVFDSSQQTFPKLLQKIGRCV